jgi:O-antigen/teichoic acid export membrane protein
MEEKRSFIYILFCEKLGINKAIFYSVGSRIIQALGGVFTLFFIAKYLNVEEQGYYYTFGSILALQVFFELGLSSILSQFVAHEFVHLRWNGCELVGDEYYKQRLSSLLHFAFRWFSVMALVLFVVLFLCGYLFFNFNQAIDANVTWKSPWFLLVFVSSLNLLLTPILSYFEGLGKVKEIAGLRLVQQTVHVLVAWGCLLFGYKLYTTGIATFAIFSVAFIWLISREQLIILKRIWQYFNVANIISWKKEIFPYQWKIALSWISGYLSFQIFNPVLFATEGSIIAGQMGMTLTVFNGITSLAMSWINTKIPTMSGYIALREFRKLDLVFFKTLKQGLFICFFFVVIYLLGIKSFGFFDVSLAERFLSIDLLILLSLVTLSNIVVFFLAAYLRCFKREPYLYMSLSMGIATTLSTILLGYYIGVYGIVVGYTCLSLFMYLPWALKVFINKKRDWCE